MKAASDGKKVTIAKLFIKIALPGHQLSFRIRHLSFRFCALS